VVEKKKTSKAIWKNMKGELQKKPAIYMNLLVMHAQDSSSSSSEEEKLEDNDDKVSSKASPWTVMPFTTLGALDEISYFPSLILGKIFIPSRFDSGDITCIMHCTYCCCVFFLSRFKPILDWLDRIPLYGIVAAFALVLIIGVVVDVVR